MRKLNKLLTRVLTRARLHRPALSVLAKDFWRYGEPEIQLLPWLVDPGKLSVDVGAANGLYSWHLMRISKNVVAFEPNPDTITVLRKALPNLDVRQIALSCESGSSQLRVPIITTNILALFLSGRILADER